MLSILRSVTGGWCLLVDPDDVWVKPQIVSDRVELPVDATSRLAELLLDTDSWFFARKRCLPKGTAIIQLQSPEGDVNLVIGMTCSDWEIQVGGVRRGGFFDPVVDQVRDILNQAFLKQTFPEIASPKSHSLWKEGTISKLRERAVEQHNN